LYNLMVVSTEGQAADAGVKGPESAASTEDGGRQWPAMRPTSPDSWQAEFKRLEEAWLAGRTVIAASDIVT